MAALGNQAESGRVVEPATHEVQRTAHTGIPAANPMTYGTSAGFKFDAEDHATTNYATPQGEKLLMDVQLDEGVELVGKAAGGGGGDDYVPEPQIVDGNSKVKMADDVPGLIVNDAPLTADDIPDVAKIGGGAHESKEINGIPITPQIAAEVRRSEDKAGHDTGKGSAAARVQSAAAFNVREGVVPPVGTVDIGTDRGVNTVAAKRQTVQRIQHGAITHTPAGGL